ncbi:hypothetical protein BHE90_017021 [Fusarium euwallaceae]|uniref:Uncharacterized protein n=1 Tax=Fusarium euwallaceae TaxID=1147111 RepID=A0A430KYS4_9HYPO|nr:hypothetical protein BHE90_017021 [Fusarium euwallaceae]
MEKLQYNAERLVSSAVVRAYDVMIKEGGAYSTLANGFVRVLLHVPYDDLATLYYHLCEPNGEIDGEDEQNASATRRQHGRVGDLKAELIGIPTIVVAPDGFPDSRGSPCAHEISGWL